MSRADEYQGVKFPLNAEHLLELLNNTTGRGALDQEEALDQILTGVEWLEGVDRVRILLLDPEVRQVREGWRSIDGFIEVEDWSLIWGSRWEEAIRHGGIYCECSEEEKLEGLPALEEPYQDRCFLPLRSGFFLAGLLIFESREKGVFHHWDAYLLTILGKQLGTFLQSTRSLDEAESKLAGLQDRSVGWNQAARMGALARLASGVESKISLPTICLLHNFTALRGYVQALLAVLDYSLDEIRLSSGSEGLERASNYADRFSLSSLRADLDPLFQESDEMLFQIKSLVRELQQFANLQETDARRPLDIREILQPAIHLAFEAVPKRIRVERNFAEVPAVKAQRAPLAQALLSLLLATVQTLEKQEGEQKVTISTGVEERKVFVRFETPERQEEEAPLQRTAQELLYSDTGEIGLIKQIIKQQGGKLTVLVSGETKTLTLWMPTCDEPPTSETPCAPLPAEDPTPQTFGARKRPSLLILGDRKRFLRSLRRVLKNRYEVYVADSIQEALDLLDVHPSIRLILCELVMSVEDGMEFLDRLQMAHAERVERVFYLVGTDLSQHAREFVERMRDRCLSKYSSPEEVERFISYHLSSDNNNPSNDDPS